MQTETKPTTLARAPDGAALAQFRGTHTDALEITKKLEDAARTCHLVSPAPAVAAVPDGCAVAMRAVLVDPAETYPLPGSSKVGLGKNALDKIAAAAGISWDPRQSGRLDSGKDPRYVHYRVVGTYRHFDGSVVTIQGEKIMDMRDGSPEVEGLTQRARQKDRDASGQIREIRMHLLSHAETKARLRAIRSLGIRTGYAEQDLRKPFVVARLQLTGRFADPASKAAYDKKLTESFLGASAAAYGPAAPQALPMTETPPVGAIDDRDPDERGEADEKIDPATGEVTPAAAPPAEAPAPAPKLPTIPKGKGLPGEGKTLRDATDDELRGCVAAVSKLIDGGALSAAQAQSAERFRDACIATLNERELAKRDSQAPASDTLFE